MIKNEVDEKYANQIIAEVQPSIKKDTNVDTILGAIYQKIILKLGQPRTITIEPGERKAVFFIGPTGVGKTTTIAKIAAHFKLECKSSIDYCGHLPYCSGRAVKNLCEYYRCTFKSDLYNGRI